ncbi:MAG: adenylosuccinate synthase [Bacteroidota bacterium]|nr:adenylosuccinate synthase [Bacteroidota bacterium]MDE2835506.1 adenylosuccinate synthase [Bacteroidota bacterium]
MAVTVVVGSQWGDEGKGKIVDLIAPEFDIVARYQGGANAGHTIQWGDQTQVLHLIPSGAFADGVTCVIGNGVVVDPCVLVREISAVHDLGFNLEGRLWIARNAHCIVPWHLALDSAREATASDQAIGTTRRGIGPAYVDKVARSGIRMGDLLCTDLLAARLRGLAREKNHLLTEVFGQRAIHPDEVIEAYAAFGRKLRPYLTDTPALLHQALAEGRSVLAEGAQGSLLDLDFGTYPFVTSSSPTAGGACTGLGIPPGAIERVIGITKAYCTRVGNGPFPTELDGSAGAFLQAAGVEFGATTGRLRRCGWLDLVALRYACQLNGFTGLALTKIDVLTGLDTINVCIDYRIADRKGIGYSSAVSTLEKVEPVYRTIPGWTQPVAGATSFDELPDAAHALIRQISLFTGLPIDMVSTGPKRHQIIHLGS